MTLLDWTLPKTIPRTKNNDSTLYTAKVVTLQNCLIFPIGAIVIFKINMLNTNFKFLSLKRHILVRDRIAWAIVSKSHRRVWPVSEFLKKNIWIATKIFAYVSPICQKAPVDQIYIKLRTRGHLADVINCAKFYLNQIRGCDSVGGRQIFGFPIRKRSPRQHMAWTTAQPVMLIWSVFNWRCTKCYSSPCCHDCLSWCLSPL